MKPLSELLKESDVYFEHNFMGNEIVDRASFEKIKAVAIVLAEALENQAGLFGDCGEFSKAGETLTQAAEILKK
jgi:hypothetical protein